MKHYHWSQRSNRAVSHSHAKGNIRHIHSSKGWLHYGRTKRGVVSDERAIRRQTAREESSGKKALLKAKPKLNKLEEPYGKGTYVKDKNGKRVLLTGSEWMYGLHFTQGLASELELTRGEENKVRENLQIKNITKSSFDPWIHKKQRKQQSSRGIVITPKRPRVPR